MRAADAGGGEGTNVAVAENGKIDSDRRILDGILKADDGILNRITGS